jgi:hypothetical protein
MGESEMARKRNDGYPEMAMVRRFLQSYVDGFSNNAMAAEKIGTTGSTLCKWLNGVEPIPAWMCDYLGFEKQWIYVGKVGIKTTGLAGKCLENAARRYTENRKQSTSPQTFQAQEASGA